MADSAPSAPSTKFTIAAAWAAEAVLLWYFWAPQVNGEDNASATSHFETYITPSKMAFSIWGLILLCQFLFVVFQFIQTVPQVSRKFVSAWVTCMIATGLWPLVYEYQCLKVAAAALLLLILLTLVGMYLALFPDGNTAYPDGTAKYWMSKLWVSVEMAWVSVAFIVNVAQVLSELGWHQDSRGALSTSIAVQALVAVLALVVLFQRSDVPFAAVFVWAFNAIRMHQDERAVRGAATAFTALLVFALVITFLSPMFLGPRAFMPLE